jgi:NAD+ kinase
MTHKAGLWVNESRVCDKQKVEELQSWFTDHGWQSEPFWPENRTEKIDFLLALGGDGTFLEAAREAAPYDIPVLGVNFGRLGFLCEVEQSGLYPALTKILSGEYVVEERLMLMADLSRETGEIRHIVLNDVVFNRFLQGGLITLEVRLSGEPIASPPGDGLVVATPTGSTAYSVSAGGPVVSPEVEGILLTNIAPHALSARPMVVSAKEDITITLGQGEQCYVTFDGAQQLVMEENETMHIVKAKLRARLLRLDLRSFPRMVRQKLRDR